MAKVFVSFYANYLKSKTNPICGYIVGADYINKLVFYIRLLLVRTRLMKLPAGI